MTQLFGIPLDTLTIILVIASAIIVVGVLLLAIFYVIFFKVGVRNIPRRRTQMLLIIFALMLSTTLLTSVLATGDVITSAAQSVAVYNLGGVDETITGGGSGPLGSFDDRVYFQVHAAAKNDANIAAVGAALVEHDLLLADETSRQVRSKVTALAIIPDSEQGFGGMQDDSGKGHHSIAELQLDQVFLNHTAAMLLNAHAGDKLYLYSKRWPGRRFVLSVRAIVVDGGLVGSTPYILAQNKTFLQFEGYRDAISEVFISLHNNIDTNGVDLSERAEDAIRDYIPAGASIHEVQEQGVHASQQADDIFSRIFSLFALFALAIGLLLIFLIFVLLAAERRAEMGMARAIGVQRRHLVLMYLFEGTVYDLLSSFVGLLIGVGVGTLLVLFLEPILERFNFPLNLVFQPRSLIIAYCLGVIFTFFSVGVSAWLVSRMTVVDALRNLPESERPTLSLLDLLVRLLASLRHIGAQLRNPGRLIGQISDTLIGLVRSLTLLGFLPLLAGYWLMQQGLESTQIAYFSLGLSLIAVGGGLVIKAVIEFILRLVWRSHDSQRARSIAGKIFAAVAGLALVAYWGLPFDALANLGLPRFYGGIEIFFLAAFMMVLGAVWVLIANAELIVKPLLALFSRLAGLYVLAWLAAAYPLHRRFRTGLSVVMFSLVVFAMTVMAIITNAMQNTYANIDTQTGGYDIQAVA